MRLPRPNVQPCRSMRLGAWCMRYYWFQLCNTRPETLSKMMTEDMQHAFEEDRDVLNAVQIGMSNKNSPHIDLSIDGGQLDFDANFRL